MTYLCPKSGQELWLVDVVVLLIQLLFANYRQKPNGHNDQVYSAPSYQDTVISLGFTKFVAEILQKKKTKIYIWNPTSSRLKM